MTNPKRCLKSIGKEPTKPEHVFWVSVVLKGQGFELSHDKSKTKPWLSGFQAPLGGLQVTRMPTVFKMGYIFFKCFLCPLCPTPQSQLPDNFCTPCELEMPKENIKEMKRKDKNTKKERNESLVLLAKTEKSKCQSDLSDFDRRQKDQANTQHQTDSQVWNQICQEHIWVTFHPKTKWEYFA